MKKIISVFLGILLALGFIGCASLSKQECLNADWKLIGFEDGSQGKPESTIGAHRKSCAKVNVTPDLALYQLGHRDGARKYCVKSTAYKLGVSGGAYYDVCPADLEPGFLQAYRAGQDLYGISRQINTLESNISGYSEDILALEKDIGEHEQIIADSGSSSKVRREQLRIIDDLHRQITNLELDIADTQKEIYLLQQDYQHMQQQHRRRGFQ